MNANAEITMKPMKHRLNLVAAATAVAFFALAACQDRKPSQAPPPPASSGEYPTPSSVSPTSSSDPVAVPGTGTDATAKDTTSGMVGGASGTVASGGKPGSGSTSGAGTGAAESSDAKPASKK